ncbi:hypothetical protein MYX07_06110, partial [Patescibacteria group bacterium AH-259-L07]|nr:hypothetical protein [Patescibacteria group bacterium AH-259-L07]
GGTGTLSLDGTYSLKVTSGDTWHVSVATEVSDTFYESDETDITTTAGSNTANLTLESRNFTIPDAKTTSYDSSQSKNIILKDGTEIEMPAGTVKSSGTVTITVTPQTDARPDSKDKPVGISYDFVAKDSNGQEITKFVNDVQITLKYDEAVLTAAGFDENDVKPKYYDDTTGTWENFKAVLQDTTKNTFTITTDHFTPGGLVGGRVSSAGGEISTPTPEPTPSE